MKKPKHIKLGYMDIPIEYANFNDEDKKTFCNLMIDRMLTILEGELKYAPEINRIAFLDSVLDSSLETNVAHEAYEVCQVISDMKKQLAIDT
jgi:hypothetical protein